MAIYLGSNSRNAGSPPKEINDVNTINFISAVSLFVNTVWLIEDVPDSLMADTTVSANT